MITKPVMIYSDLDGTLLDHFSYLSTPATSTLDLLKKASIPVVLTSSKTFAEITKIQSQLGIQAPFIVENGAAIFIPKSTFPSQPKDTREYKNYWIKSFCLPKAHWLELIRNTPSEFNGLYKGFSALSLKELCEITGLSELDAENAKARHYGEPLQWLGDKATKQAFIRQLQTAGACVLQGGRFIHVSGDCDKGKALNWLTQCYQQFTNKNAITTIALGDGENDLAMLQAANYAVQVRSPVHDFPVLTQHPNVIQTKQIGPAGWAEAIQQLLSAHLNKTQHSKVAHIQE